MKKIKKWTLLIIGTFTLILATIGIFLPLIPTTPLLLLSAACYIRSSTKLYNWLISHKIFGKYIDEYLKGNGIPVKVKITAILLLWVSVSTSVIYFIPILAVKILILLIAIGVTIWIISIKTLKQAKLASTD